jgi:hypothetical protein
MTPDDLRTLLDRAGLPSGYAAAKDDERDAEDLEFINEWRLEDGLPTLGDLSEAAVDELEAACARNSLLLLHRRTNGA